MSVFQNLYVLTGEFTTALLDNYLYSSIASTKHKLAQRPQPLHFSILISALSVIFMAGHLDLRHILHALHFSLLTLYFICYPLNVKDFSA